MSYSSSRVRKEWTESDDIRDARLTGSPDQLEYHDFHVTIQNPVGQKCNDDEAAFFHSLQQK